MKFRLATTSDIEGIASVHIQAWKETYKGIVLDKVLDGLNMNQKIKQWEEILDQQENHDNGQTWVATEREGLVIGFAHFCKERTGKYEIDGELTAIYILKQYHRKGIGKSLLQNGIDYLLSIGCKSMLVWVLVENPSRIFYESFSPVEIDREPLNIGGKINEEVAYAWRNLLDLKKLVDG